MTEKNKILKNEGRKINKYLQILTVTSHDWAFLFLYIEGLLKEHFMAEGARNCEFD